MNYDTTLSVRQIASKPCYRDTFNAIKVYFIQKYFMVDFINCFPTVQWLTSAKIAIAVE